MKRLALSLLAGLLASSAFAGPNVTITKNCPSLRYLGRQADFDIVVTNTGDAAAMNVVVTDTMTGGQFINADNGGTREGGNVVWRIGTLNAGESRSLKMSVSCNQKGTIKNRAMVTYCAEAAAECETEVKGIPAILLECVDDLDPQVVGGTLTYTITVTNQGTENDTNIIVKATLPAEQQFVSAGGAADATASGQDITFAAIPTLAPGAKAVVTVTVKGLRAGDARFKLTMKSDQISSEVMETESTRFYE